MPFQIVLLNSGCHQPADSNLTTQPAEESHSRLASTAQTRGGNQLLSGV